MKHQILFMLIAFGVQGCTTTQKLPPEIEAKLIQQEKHLADYRKYFAEAAAKEEADALAPQQACPPCKVRGK